MFFGWVLIETSLTEYNFRLVPMDRNI